MQQSASRCRIVQRLGIGEFAAQQRTAQRINSRSCPRKKTIGRSPRGRVWAKALIRCRSSLLQIRPMARSCRTLVSGSPVPLTTVFKRAQATKTASRLSEPNSPSIVASVASMPGNNATSGWHENTDFARGPALKTVGVTGLGRIRPGGFTEAPWTRRCGGRANHGARVSPIYRVASSRSPRIGTEEWDC